MKDRELRILRKIISEVWEEMEASNDNSVGDGVVYPQELDGVKTLEIAGVYTVHVDDLAYVLFPEEFGPWGLSEDEMVQHFAAWAAAHDGIYYEPTGSPDDLESELVGAAIDGNARLVVYP